MRKVLLFPFLLFLGLKIFACHTTSIDNVTIVNNANADKIVVTFEGDIDMLNILELLLMLIVLLVKNV